MSMPFEGPRPAAAAQPGPPPVLWAPSECGGTEIPWRPGILVYHRMWNCWVRLLAEEVAGEHPPPDGILLEPATPTDGAPDLAGRVEHLEQMLRELGGRGDGRPPR
jgi:hypothetical protein